jgi:hypothetical protein
MSERDYAVRCLAQWRAARALTDETEHERQPRCALIHQRGASPHVYVRVACSDRVAACSVRAPRRQPATPLAAASRASAHMLAFFIVCAVCSSFIMLRFIRFMSCVMSSAAVCRRSAVC